MSNEAFYRAKALEEQNRLQAYLALQRPLHLPTIASGIVQFPLVTITWRHWLELTESGNALVLRHAAASRSDFFGLLWRLNPFYRDPAGMWPNLNSADIRCGAFRSRMARWVVWLSCRRLSISEARAHMRARLDETLQDRPSTRVDAGTGEPVPLSPLMPDMNVFDEVSEFFSSRGFRMNDLLDSGVAWSLQVFRAYLVANGQGVRIIPPSASLYHAKQEAKR